MIHPVGRLFPDEDKKQYAIAVEKPNPRGHNDKTSSLQTGFPKGSTFQQTSQSTCCKRTLPLGLYR
ncbi:MAG: hypothetical protein AB1861_00485 [Cyanobacteriota bacterium]